MTLANYTDLLAAVQDWLGDRTDLVAKIPDFITLTEADLNNRDTFRLRDMESSTALTPTSGVCTLPADFLELRSVTLNTSPARALTLADHGYVTREFDTTADEAEVYTISGSSLTLYPNDGTTITLKYYAKIPALATTNWLMTKAPNVYLYGTCLHAARWATDQEQEARFTPLYEQAVLKLENADKGARWPRYTQNRILVRP